MTNAVPLSKVFDFEGRVALITGAGRGIGSGIARRFGEAGASTIVHYRTSETEAWALAEEIVASGGQAETYAADLVDPQQVQALFEHVSARFGRLDVLVNNAGAYPLTPMLSMENEEFAQVVDANLRSVALMTKGAAELMQKGENPGAIINIASIEASAPAPNHSHYCAAKAGVVMHTRCAALELGPQVRVNSVSPGLIWYPELESLWPEGVERYKQAAPAGRLGTRTEVADACLFLASDAARFITGANLVVDGGVSATPYF